MMLHLRFEGLSYELERERLQLKAGWSDTAVKRKLSGFFRISFDRFDSYHIQRRPNRDAYVPSDLLNA